MMYSGKNWVIVLQTINCGQGDHQLRSRRGSNGYSMVVSVGVPSDVYGHSEYTMHIGQSDRIG